MATSSSTEAARLHFQHPGVVEQYTLAVNRVGLWRSEESLFAKLFAPADAILELGCGAGRIALELYAKGYSHIQGLDLSPGMISAAKDVAAALNRPVPFEVGDATQLRFQDQSFNGVIFGFNGLMQIPGKANRRAAMAEAFRVLKPHGTFVFTSHDRDLPRFSDYWEEEAKKWALGTQDPRLLEFGDRLYDTPQSPCYIHIPTQAEIISELATIGFTLASNSLRSELAIESEAVREFSDDCRFWVAHRP